jgi:hypothetical protein
VAFALLETLDFFLGTTHPHRFSASFPGCAACDAATSTTVLAAPLLLLMLLLARQLVPFSPVNFLAIAIALWVFFKGKRRW